MRVAARGTTPREPRADPAGVPGAPGDLFVLRQTAHCPLEWAVVGSDGGSPARLQVVPADTHPAAGSADVRVPARAASGPLSLRCGFALWVPAAFLSQGVRSGRLDDAALAQAQRRIADLQQGNPTGTPLDREAEGDPEYLDWMNDSVEPAAAAMRAARADWEAARGAGRNQVAMPHRLPLQASSWAAAALLLVALGLSWTTFSLQRKIDGLSQPLFDLPNGEITFGSPTRGPDAGSLVLTVPPQTGHVLLTLVIGPKVPTGGAGRLEIQTLQGAAIWHSPPFQLKASAEINMVVSRALLPDTSYRLALFGQGGDRTDPLEIYNLEFAPPH